jgi:hypothetical protein
MEKRDGGSLCTALRVMEIDLLAAWRHRFPPENIRPREVDGLRGRGEHRVAAAGDGRIDRDGADEVKRDDDCEGTCRLVEQSRNPLSR